METAASLTLWQRQGVLLRRRTVSFPFFSITEVLFEDGSRYLCCVQTNTNKFYKGCVNLASGYFST